MSLDCDRLLIVLTCHKIISVYYSAICISQQKYEEMSKKYKLFQRKKPTQAYLRTRDFY